MKERINLNLSKLEGLKGISFDKDEKDNEDLSENDSNVNSSNI